MGLGPLLRRLVFAALVIAVAGGLAAPARAGTRVLMPRVSYRRSVQFTAHGPVVLNVIVAPRPGGLYQLKPLLSNGTIVGLERVTSMQRDVSASATAAGVNGDLFNREDGHPTGVLVEDGVLKSPPYRFRSSIGVTAEGRLDVARVSSYGYWQGSGRRHPLTGLNRPPRADATSLFTSAYGTSTPPLAGAVEVVVQPFPPAVPGQSLAGTVTAQAAGGGTPIPADGAVLVASGSQAETLAGEAPVGGQLAAGLTLGPQWRAAEVTQALGGGPLIVRSGRPVLTAGEDFLPSQLNPLSPRTAVGQRRNGKIVLLAVDGRQPGFSSGLTNWELAEAMAQLGAYTASALDSGGSTTMAFDGKLLNRPSDPGGERAVGESLAVLYTGVYVPPPVLPVVSPNGDGVADRQRLSYKVVAPATVTARLLDPAGRVVLKDVRPREPGIYAYHRPILAKHRVPRRRLGRWRWVVSAVDLEGRRSAMQRSFRVNDTLGFIRVAPRSLKLRRRVPGRVAARFRLAHNAWITPSIWTAKGTLVRRLPRRLFSAGVRAVFWDGRLRSGRLARRGAYLFKVDARNGLGADELARRFVIRR